VVVVATSARLGSSVLMGERQPFDGLCPEYRAVSRRSGRLSCVATPKPRHPGIRLIGSASERLTSLLTVGSDLENAGLHSGGPPLTRTEVFSSAADFRLTPVPRETTTGCARRPKRQAVGQLPVACLRAPMISRRLSARERQRQSYALSACNWPGAAAAYPGQIACSGGHSGGHSTRPYCSQPDRTQRNAFPT
jgi:hypothetical protein